MTDEKPEQPEVQGKEDHSYTPAYVAVQTLLGFVDGFDPRAMPKRIDRSMMHSQSGGTQRKLMSALTFLGLINPGGEVTERFRELVVAKDDPEQRKQALAAVIDAAYTKVIGDLDVGTASAKQLTDAFKAAGVEGATLQDAVRFYVKARKAAGLPVSRYIEAGKPRGPAAKPSERNGPKARPKRTNETAATDPVGGAGDGGRTAKPHDTPPPPGVIEHPLYFKGKPTGYIRVPADLSADDCKVIKLTLAVLEAYATQGGAAPSN
jgi:hypothetical protein